MIGRRNWMRLALALPLLGLALGSYGYISLQRLLQQQGIELRHWQGLRVSGQGLHLEQLSLQQHGNQLQLEHLQLAWSGLSLQPPYLQQLQLERLEAQLTAAIDATSSATPAVELQVLLDALVLLPEQLRIQQFSVDLPCARGRCALRGDLQLERQAAESTQRLDLQLNLATDAGPPLNGRARLQGNAQGAELQLDLAVAGQVQLQLHGQVQQSPQGSHWQGRLSSPELSAAGALQAWLGQWLEDDLATLPQLPGAAQLAAEWQLQLPPGPLDMAQLAQARGQLSASAELGEAWPVPGLGLLQGRFQLAAHNRNGQWLAQTLDADLQLAQPNAQLLAPLPEVLRPQRLLLRVEAGAPLANLHGELQGRALPLAVRLEGQGQAPFRLQGQLALANAAPWSLQWQQTRFQAKAPALTLDSLRLSALDLQLNLSGHADAQGLTLQLESASRLQLGQLQQAELQLQQLSASSPGLQLQAQYRADAPLQWQLQGPVELNLDNLQQPQLKPQSWRVQGQLEASGSRQRFSGSLSNAAGLSLALQLQQAASGLTLQAQLGELFLRGGNPLQQSFSAWPALLSLNNGRLKGLASLSLPAGARHALIQAEIDGKGLAGIYDRSELSGLDLHLQLRSDGRQLTLELDELRLAEINPGLPIGPLQLKGRYQAATSQLDKGLLQIEQAHTALMGGQVQLAPGQWNLAEEALLLPLEVRGVELEQLFILYPTEGLAGSGSLDGQLPLRIDASGVSISQGQLSARQPGGRLQFHSERIRALGRSNPAMQLVTQSLEDFRYQVLSTRLDYDQQGKLNLAMRLEGQNPAIEQGRPIHFTINLEEDIPSLLASLQLTDKVSEVIRQRVQQRMLQRQSTLPSAP